MNTKDILTQLENIKKDLNNEDIFSRITINQALEELLDLSYTVDDSEFEDFVDNIQQTIIDNNVVCDILTDLNYSSSKIYELKRFLYDCNENMDIHFYSVDDEYIDDFNKDAIIDFIDYLEELI